MVQISVIIPCFQSTSGFPERICEISDELSRHVGPDGAEIVLVADGPETAKNPSFLAALNARPQVKCVIHAKNYGEHAALQTGILHSSGDVIVTLDDDGQHPTAAIWEVLAPVLSGEKMLVYGLANNHPHGRLRGWLSSGVKLLISKTAGLPIRSISSFRAFSGQLRHAFVPVQPRELIIDSVLLDHIDTPHTTSFNYQTRQEGRSGYGLRRLFRHALGLVLVFGGRPLKLFGVTGLLVLGAGLALLASSVVEFLAFGNLPPGYLTTISLIIAFSGVQLIGLGLIGEYVRRLFESNAGLKSVRLLADSRHGVENQK